jgi:uncharacterized protein (TIGR01589 family)
MTWSLDPVQVVFTLQQQAQIEPGFTQLVWQKLEEQNPDFFRAYYTRLKLKDHIVLFNHLLEQQVAMFQKMQRQWMAPSGMLHKRIFLHSLTHTSYCGYPSSRHIVGEIRALAVPQKFVV